MLALPAGLYTRMALIPLGRPNFDRILICQLRSLLLRKRVSDEVSPAWRECSSNLFIVVNEILNHQNLQSLIRIDGLSTDN